MREAVVAGAGRAAAVASQPADADEVAPLSGGYAEACSIRTSARPMRLANYTDAETLLMKAAPIWLIKMQRYFNLLGILAMKFSENIDWPASSTAKPSPPTNIMSLHKRICDASMNCIHSL